MEFKAVQIIIGVLAVLRINRNIMEFKVSAASSSKGRNI